MANGNAELSRLNGDLNNFYVNIDTAILVLGRDLAVRRFTPATEKIFNLLPTDVGRPFGGIKHNLQLPDLEELIAEVIDGVTVREREIRDKSGRWYFLRVRPYTTLDNKIDGAVLVLWDIDPLKRSEHETMEARDYAEAMVRTAREALVVLRPDLRVNTANEAYYRTFKTTPDQTQGRLIHELGNGQWKIAPLIPLLEDIIPRNSFFNDFEVVHDFPSVGKRTMLLSARRLENEPSAPPLILLAIEDVTERLESRAALKRSEIRYRRLFEAAHDGILIIDSVTRKITDANPFMVEFLGCPREELLGKELWQIGLLPDEPSSHAAFRALQEVGFVRYDSQPVKTKDGGNRQVEVIAKLYTEEGQKLIQYNMRDTTERKLAVEALHRALQFDEAVVRSMGEGLYTLDDQGLVTMMNPTAERHFGWTLEELRGKRMHDITHFKRRDGSPFPAEECAIMQVLRDAKALTHHEDFFIRKDGTFFDVTYSSSPILDGDKVTGLVVVFRDVTEPKRVEQALRQIREKLADQAAHLELMVRERTVELTAANKQLETFVYSVAHDLRAPLRAMQSYAAMLVEESGEQLNETSRGFADRINRSAQFMDALLMDLLAFSRIGQRIELVPVDLGPVVRNILSRLEKDIRDKNARVEIGPAWPRVRAHEQMVGQVLFNLMSNSLKFSRPTPSRWCACGRRSVPGWSASGWKTTALA